MQKSEIKEQISAGQLAKLTGVSTDTLRHYERKGVLPSPPRSQNGYRHYPVMAVERVRLVRSALSVGFTLDELAVVLKARDQGGAPCHKVRELALVKLSEIESRLIEMISMRDELFVTLKEWDKRLSSTRAGQPAHLLESLAKSASRGIVSQRPGLSRLKNNKGIKK